MCVCFLSLSLSPSLLLFMPSGRFAKLPLSPSPPSLEFPAAVQRRLHRRHRRLNETWLFSAHGATGRHEFVGPDSILSPSLFNVKKKNHSIEIDSDSLLFSALP